MSFVQNVDSAIQAIFLYPLTLFTVPGAEEKASPVTVCALHALPPPGVAVTLDLHSLLKPVTIAMLFLNYLLTKNKFPLMGTSG
jgi:hypothetical protein